MADQKLTDKGSLSSFDDNDLIHVVDVSDTTSSAEGTSKKGLWSLFKSTLKTYFDTIYFNLNIAGQINSETEKTNTDPADVVVIEDSEDSYNKKKVKIENLDKSAYKDATWCVFGDSTVNSLTGDWIGVALDSLGVKDSNVTINAVAGDRIDQQLADLDTLLAGDANYMQSFDYCSLSVGVNDHSQSQTLGTINDTSSDATVIGYFKDFIEKIYTSNPEIKLYVTTPLKYENSVFGWFGVNYDFWTLSDLANSIAKICSQYSTSCVDLYNISSFNELTGSTLSDDVNPLHPNATGKVIVGNEFARAVRGGAGVGNMYPPTDKFLAPLTVTQGENSTPTILNIRNTDNTLLVDEFLGYLRFLSNDTSLGTDVDVGGIKCILEDAGFWYALGFFVTGSSGVFEAGRFTRNGYFRVTKNNSTQIEIERTGAAPSTIYIKNTSDKCIIDYVGGSGGIEFQVEGTLQMKIAENGRISMYNLPTSSAGLSTGDLWNDSGTVKIV